MQDTDSIRKKLLKLWTDFDNKKLSAAEARVHIGMARAVLETLKIEIAAAHLDQLRIPSVSLSSGVERKQLSQRRAAA